jgi:hypothetical protein
VPHRPYPYPEPPLGADARPLTSRELAVLLKEGFERPVPRYDVALLGWLGLRPLPPRPQ